MLEHRDGGTIEKCTVSTTIVLPGDGASSGELHNVVAPVLGLRRQGRALRRHLDGSFRGGGEDMRIFGWQF